MLVITLAISVSLCDVINSSILRSLKKEDKLLALVYSALKLPKSISNWIVTICLPFFFKTERASWNYLDCSWVSASLNDDIKLDQKFCYWRVVALNKSNWVFSNKSRSFFHITESYYSFFTKSKLTLSIFYIKLYNWPYLITALIY